MVSGGYTFSRRDLATVVSIVSVVIAILSFTVGRWSAVGDLRKEISDHYVPKDQYTKDQDQLARALSELSQQNRTLDGKITTILIQLTRNRKIVADNLIAEPD